MSFNFTEWSPFVAKLNDTDYYLKQFGKHEVEFFFFHFSKGFKINPIVREKLLLEETILLFKNILPEIQKH